MRFFTTAALATAAAAAPSPWGPPSWGPGHHGGPPSHHGGPPAHHGGPPAHHGPPGFGGHHGPHGYNKKAAAYFLDDNASGASVVAMKIGEDGKLSDPVRTSTGGNGAYAVSAAGVLNVADPLNSQNSIIVDGDYLFTINTGSDTIVMFRIDPENPQHLAMVGSPQSTKGQFPVSVAYSSEIETACVVNGGAVDGVACYKVNPYSGLHPVGGLRSLGPALNETTPPTTPPLSASQILFTPSLDAVVALTKGDASTTPVTPSWVVAWAIEDGSISMDPVLTSLTETPMLFGSVFLPDGTLFASDASFGGAFLTIGEDLKATVGTTLKYADQVAICWTAYDPELDLGLLPDAGANVIYTVDISTMSKLSEIPVTTSNDTANGPGIFDTEVLNNKAYGLGAEPGIVVVDLVKGEQIQFLDLNSIGSRQGFTGMAIYA